MRSVELGFRIARPEGLCSLLFCKEAMFRFVNVNVSLAVVGIIDLFLDTVSCSTSYLNIQSGMILTYKWWFPVVCPASVRIRSSKIAF